MDGKHKLLTPQKRSIEGSEVWHLNKRTRDSGGVSSREIVSASPRVYKLKILLPNGRAVLVKIPEGTEIISARDLANRVKQQCDRAVLADKASGTKKSVKWDADLCFVDDYDRVFKTSIKLTRLEMNRVYNLRLDDGSQPSTIYENMWDLTPETELLMEFPEEYTFETALADLIDNALQAVWTNDENDERLISVGVSNEKISIFDTGSGMDSTSIEKWGKMGASLHRSYRTQAIGGKPPYLKPAFGMFGYGGFIASMHLGRRTEVSSKTKTSKKVYMLCLERDALVSGSVSGSKRSWRTYGGLRDPTKKELELSPGGSFTKVEIFEPKMRSTNIRRLKCKLKDIYFPYIQCDDLSKKGKTTTPIEFLVNGDDLAEIPGGEVAITNLTSCIGPEFVLQVRFKLNHDNATMTSSPGTRSSDEANARLRCVYLPVKEGKESIESVITALKESGYDYIEDFGSFRHVSCRRLGRLLPDARWAWLPFMDFRQRKTDRSQVFLKRSSMRVKCFIETDAGFSPTPSKTDFAHQNPFTTALRNLGSKQSMEKDSDSFTGVDIDIRRDGKSLNIAQLDKQYQIWLREMHERYDEEVDSGIDEPVLIVNPSNKKALHISSDVVRVHKSFRRKEKTWKSGQKIKILKGACAGFHNNNVYATLEYSLFEGFHGDAGGDAWIICRTIDISEKDGCLLKSVEENPKIELRKSVSIPMNVIDSGKLLAVDDSEWNNQMEKKYQKCPSSIEILTSGQCRELGVESSLPDESETYANDDSRGEIIAVVRPGTYNSGTPSKQLDQKYVMKDNFEMSLMVTYSANKKQDENNIYSGRVEPSSLRDLQGLYVFKPKCKSHPLFHKAGTYTFTFSIRDSNCEKRVVKVQVKPSRDVHRWALTKKISHHNLTVGCPCNPISISMFDKYDNQIPFLELPDVCIKINCLNDTRVIINDCSPSISIDKLGLVIEDLVIESSDLDSIRPGYNATMVLFHPGSHLDIPIKVLPGSVQHFTVQPENFEKQLIPGTVVKELILELFDAYGNHVEENKKVELSVGGFCWLNRSSSSKKVDACGCIDLSGLLKVTEGYYGRNVLLSICSSEETPISKEWHIEKRQLRISSEMPESCFAGSQLENLEFEVVNSKGEVDVNFHDDDEIGQSHTLVIKSEFMDIDEPVKYVFREGRCIVRAVSVPSERGEFTFVAAHSRCSDLQLTLKVLVELPSETEPLNTSHNLNVVSLMESETPLDYTSPCYHTPKTKDMCLAMARQQEADIESCLEFQKDLWNEILEIGLRIGELEQEIEKLEEEQKTILANLSECEGIRGRILSIGTHDSLGKDKIMACIESKSDCAGSLVMKHLKAMRDQDRHGLMGNIIGIVALLGTTTTFELSRLFAEYLGEQMLAVVCKHYEDGRLLERYDKNGKLNPKFALHMFARELGQSINGRYYVLCIEDMRACMVEKDAEGKLLFPDPTLSDGSRPAGFLGFAVNMINIDVDHLHTKTDSGCGLRETLFYRLFGETQVYETRDDMKRAISCLKDGAVSMDGGILRGNGAMCLGCLEPDIIFPVEPARNQLLSKNATRELDRYRELKLKLKETTAKLVKKRKSLESDHKRRFKERRDLYVKYFARPIHQL